MSNLSQCDCQPAEIRSQNLQAQPPPHPYKYIILQVHILPIGGACWQSYVPPITMAANQPRLGLKIFKPNLLLIPIFFHSFDPFKIDYFAITKKRVIQM